MPRGPGLQERPRAEVDRALLDAGGVHLGVEGFPDRSGCASSASPEGEERTCEVARSNSTYQEVYQMKNEIPPQFLGGPDSNPNIVRALQFLDKVPAKIRTAWEKAREAAWAWKKGSSLDLAAEVARRTNHLSERLRMADGDLTDPSVV